jgi:RNA polymerase sigma-70 factor (ECF subfamily)
MKVEDINIHIRNVQNGNLNSFRYVIDNYKKMAMNLALSILKNREQAEDTVQDSFVLAFNNIGKFNFSTKFSTWFYKIVLNQSLSVIRKSKIDFVSISDDENFEEIPDESFEFMDEVDISTIIKNSIELLSSIDSVVLKMYYYEDTSIEEISKVLDIKYANAKVILHRARLKLKNEILKNYKNEIKDWI